MTENTEQCLAECFAIFDLFRRLGFTPEQIFFLPDVRGPSLRVTVGMELLVEGERFSVALDTCDDPVEAAAAWPAFAEGLKDRTQAELQALWDRATFAPHYAVAIVAGLKLKGIRIPRLAQFEAN